MPYPQVIEPESPINLISRRCSVTRLQATHRILIMALGAFGDILLRSPILTVLRDTYPQSYISWIVEQSNVDAINANPFIDEVIVWDSSYWNFLLPRRWKKYINLKRGFGIKGLFNGLKLFRLLRNMRVNVFISYQPEEWPYLALGVNAPRSIGIFPHPKPGCSKDYSRQRQFFTHTFAYPDLPLHRMDQYLLPLTSLDIASSNKQMMIGYTEEDAKEATQFLMRNGLLPQDRFIVLAPMTTWSSKNWPCARYAALGDLLSQEYQCRIVLVGSASDRDSIEEMAGWMKIRPVVTAGLLTFRQSAAMFSKAALVICGDTGPMHIAAAVDAPYVAIFGPTSSEWYAPLVGTGVSIAHEVPCGPCGEMICPNHGEDYLRCQTLTTIEEVYEKACRLLNSAHTIVRHIPARQKKH